MASWRSCSPSRSSPLRIFSRSRSMTAAERDCLGIGADLVAVAVAIIISTTLVKNNRRFSGGHRLLQLCWNHALAVGQAANPKVEYTPLQRGRKVLHPFPRGQATAVPFPRRDVPRR